MITHFVLFLCTVFTLEPGPGPVLAPVKTQIQLNCSVIEDFRIEWDVVLREDSGRTMPMFFAGIGIEVVMANILDTNSRLLINGTARNNRTNVTCVAVDVSSNLSSNLIERVPSRPVQVIFYGMINIELAVTPEEVTDL